MNAAMSRLDVTRDTESLSDGTYIQNGETDKRKSESVDKPYNESIMKHTYRTGV